MLDRTCRRCHSDLSKAATHCPTCGYGGIDPDPAKHLPDEALSTPRQILDLCRAYQRRLDEPGALMENYSAELKGWQGHNPLQDGGGKPPFAKEFNQRMLAATEWVAFENPPAKTDPIRGLTFAYVRVFRRMAEVQLESEQVGEVDLSNTDAQEVDAGLKTAPTLYQHADMAIRYLAEYQRQVLAHGDIAHGTLFALLDRYWINAYAGGFVMMESAVAEVERFGVRTQQRHIDSILLSLSVLGSAANGVMSNTKVPAADMDLHANNIDMAKIVSEWVTDALDAFDTGDLNKVLWYYRHWNPELIQHIRTLNEQSQRLSDWMGQAPSTGSWPPRFGP